MTFPQTPPADLVSTYRDAIKNVGDPTCSQCNLLSHRLGNTDHAMDALKTENETLRADRAALEAKLGIMTRTTETVSHTILVDRLQTIDVEQRRTLHHIYRDVAGLIAERDALRALCERHGIGIMQIPQHVVGKRLCCTHGPHTGICGAILTPMSSTSAAGSCQCEGAAA